ncbi:helix-turn-helix domain-containing protein [Kushneria aurantia]|uniref:Helix-turn-helix domain-containing protein n=1 Tax=Kushneria aurantia TaxID=504092 RepID=A0ABV6G4J0_9GAMM|nr:XRE family transcriptional regulator [Kushneria aurantia]
MFSTISLEIARERRGLTKKELAVKAGLTPEHLTRVIKGKHIPDDAAIGSLAAALEYPKSFFLDEPSDQLVQENVSFRNLSSLTARDRNRAIQAGTLALALNDWMNKNFSLPTFKLADERFEDPAVAAHALRSYWGIGNRPIPNLLKLLEMKGMRIFSLDRDNSMVDAYSFYRGSQPYIMLNNSKSAERSRFNLAHELGHLIMHMHIGSDGEASNPDAKENHPDNIRRQEKEADQFASNFLMPPEDVKDHLPIVRNLDQLIDAKKRWRVSVAALARKCFDLGILTDWRYRAICQEISVRGYRRNEPEEIEKERSVILEKMLNLLMTQRKTLSDLAKENNLPEDEVDTLIQGVLLRKTARPESAKLSLV